MMRRFVSAQLAWIGAGLLSLLGVLPARGDAIVSDCTEAALRDAIAQGGVVTFDSDCTFVLSDTIVITEPVTLDAAGLDVAIDGNNAVRLFMVMPSGSLELNGITLTNGNSTNGGAIYVQAGGQFTASECVFAANHASGVKGVDGANGSSSSGTGSNGRSGTGGGNARGGAIYSEGDLTLTTCQFLTNTAFGGGGGNGGNGGNGGFQGGDGGGGGNAGSGLGGAIYHAGTSFSASDCTFDSNAVAGGNGGLGGTNGIGPFLGLPGAGGAGGAGSGAAVFTTEDVDIANSTFSSNVATGGNSAAGGTLSSGNGSNGPRGGESVGGGLYNGGTSSLTNCTFFNNRVRAGNGGNGGPGQFTSGDGGNGGNGTGGGLCNSNDITVVNCTFSSCVAIGGTNGVPGLAPFLGSNGSPGKGRGGGVAQGLGMFWLVNSILSTNSPGTNVAMLTGTFTDAGHNISSDLSYNFTGTSKKNTNPKLATLADNGGPTETMALNLGSPALDAGDDSAAPSTDQRGFPRPLGAKSDIGAFELSFVIEGQITLETNGLAGVLVTAGGQSTTTDATGNYSLDAFGSNVLVTASMAGFTFSPTSQLVNATFDRSSVDFDASFLTFTISGRVLDGANGLAGVTVTADTASALTDANGLFTITGVRSGSYFVFATLEGFTFTAPQDVTVGPNATDVNFSVVQPLFSVSGRVTYGSSGLAGVRIFGAQQTDASGNFSLPLRADTYTFTPFKAGYAFRPTSRTVTITTNTTGIDFAAGTVFTAIRLTNNAVLLNLAGAFGALHIEASTNLVDWESLVTNNPPFQFLDTDAVNFPQRFYRTVQP